MTSSRLRPWFNALVIVLMLFGEMAAPLQVWAAELNRPAPQPVPDVSLAAATVAAPDLAQAEAWLMQTINTMLNMPADASPAMTEAAQQDMETAAHYYKKAQIAAQLAAYDSSRAATGAFPLSTVGVAAPAGSREAGPDNVYVMTANKEMDDGRTASWVIMGDPGKDPAAFDRNFSRALGIDASDEESNLLTPQNRAPVPAPANSIPQSERPAPQNRAAVPSSANPAPQSAPPVAPLAQGSNELRLCLDGGGGIQCDSASIDPHGVPPEYSKEYASFPIGILAWVDDNELSQIELGGGVCAEFFLDEDFGGDSLRRCGPLVENLSGTEWDDVISSFWIYENICPVTPDSVSVYREEDFGFGNWDAWPQPCENFSLGDYPDLDALGWTPSIDGAGTGISSIEVGDNVIFRTWAETDYGGAGLNFAVDTRNRQGSPGRTLASAKVEYKSDLSVSFTSSPSPLPPNSVFEIDYEIANNGLGIDPSVYWEVTVPEGIEVAEPDDLSSCNWIPSGSYLWCRVPDPIENGFPWESTVGFTATGSIAPGEHAIVIEVKGDVEKWADVGPENSDSVNVTIRNNVDLGVSLSAPEVVQKKRSGSTTYDVQATVTNDGPGDCEGTQLVYSLPPGTSLVSADPSQGSCVGLTCDLGAVAVSGNATVDFVISVSSSRVEGDTLVDEATVSPTDGTNDVNSFNDTATSDPPTTLTHWDMSIGAGGPGGEVHDMVYQSGTLYAGGTFGVKQWNGGSSWSSVGSGGPSGTVYALISDGSGGLYAGGDFTNVGPRLARWNGSSWSAVGGGVPSGAVYALARDGDGDLLRRRRVLPDREPDHHQQRRPLGRRVAFAGRGRRHPGHGRLPTGPRAGHRRGRRRRLRGRAVYDPGHARRPLE